ncbi:PIN domain-containing protein [candidate division WOR-3 bacterium]|nr:PIN domain-containing protein [candidate division WOR-3 bacterium]
MKVRKRFKLDIDDAYQYVAAKRHDLTLVSFDADFDRTDRGRKTPADILGEPHIAHDKPPTEPVRPRRRKR